MKRSFGVLITILMVAAMLFMFAACSGSGQTDGNTASESAGSSASEKASETASEAANASAGESAQYVVDPKTVKVGLVLSGTLGDVSINDQAYAGLQAVNADFGCEINYVETADSSVYLDAFQTYAEAGYNIIIGDSYEHQDAIEQIANDYPNVRFAIIDTTIEGYDNVTSFTYASNEASYLAGIVAGMETKTNVVGFIGGMDIPTIENFQVGFAEGVAYVNPDATVITKYIGTDSSVWYDPTTAKSLTLDCISNGADVCYHAAGSSGLGMFEACDEKGVKAIGVNVDQAPYSESVITSALTKGDTAIYLLVQSYLEGDVISGAYYLCCENGGVGLVDNALSDDVKAKVEEVTDKIISGEIVVTSVVRG